MTDADTGDTPTGAGPVPLAPPPTRRYLGLLIGVIVIAVVLLAGLGAGAYMFTQNRAFTVRTAGGRSPSPPVRPVTPEAYQDALTTADTRLAAALQPVSAARTPSATGNAVDGLRDTLLSQTSALRELAPPAALRAAHDALVDAMREYLVELGTIGPLVDEHRICTGVSAIAKISSASTATALRTAAQDLGTADAAHQYKFGTFLPAVTPDTFRQLANGTFLKKDNRGGSGMFKLENKSHTDTVVSLAPSGGKAALFVLYVRAGSTSTASGIKNGSYDIYLSGGVDWEPAIGAFTRNCTFEKFTDPIQYKATATRYQQWTFTLGGGGGEGNDAGSAEIDPADLPG